MSEYDPSLYRMSSPPLSPPPINGRPVYNQFEDLSFFTGFPRIDSLGSLATFDPHSEDPSISHTINADLIGAFVPDTFTFQPPVEPHQNHAINDTFRHNQRYETIHPPMSYSMYPRYRPTEVSHMQSADHPMTEQSERYNQPINQTMYQTASSYESYPPYVPHNQAMHLPNHTAHNEQSISQHVAGLSVNQMINNQPFPQSFDQRSDQSMRLPRKSACAACYTSKIHCDGLRPCSRCDAKGAVCEDRVKQAIPSKNKAKKRKVSSDDADQTKPGETIDLTSNDSVKKEPIRSDESVASTSSDQSSRSASEAPVSAASSPSVSAEKPNPSTVIEPASSTAIVPDSAAPEKVDPAREASRRMLNILLHEKSDLPGTIKSGLKMGTVTPVNLHALLSYFSRTLYPDDRHTLMREVQRLLSNDPSLSKIVMSAAQPVTQPITDHSTIYMPDGSSVPRVNFNFFRSPLESIPESPIGVDHPSIWIFRLWPPNEKSNSKTIKKFFRRMFKNANQPVPDVYSKQATQPSALSSSPDGVNLIVQVNRAFELLFDFRQSEMRAMMQKEGTQALYRLYRPESLYEIGGWLTQAICGLRHDFKAEVKLVRRGCSRHIEGVMNARFTLDSNRQFESVGYTYVTKTRSG